MRLAPWKEVTRDNALRFSSWPGMKKFNQETLIFTTHRRIDADADEQDEKSESMNEIDWNATQNVNANANGNLRGLQYAPH